MTRRRLLAMTTLPLLADAPKQKIVSVKAVPMPLLPAGRFGTRNFASDHDPARWRWFGPFSQLPGATLVEIRTDQGLTGYGMGGGGTAAVHIVENHLKDLLLGANALNCELLWDQMFSSSSFYGRRGLPIMAISGIDLALWDLAGKAAGVPVWRLLGGSAKEKVLAYFTGGDVERGLKLGFQAFKLGLYEGIADASPESMRKLLERLEQIRGLIGPNRKLMIDCLCRWNVEYTLEFAERAAPLKLYFIEEPLLPDDVAGYQRLCREVKGTRIACGEHEFTRFGFQEVLRNHASHILQPDLTWCGGLTDIRRVATIAAAHGVPVMPHRGSSLCGIHLVIAHSNCPMAESFGTGEPGNELMERFTAPFRDGYYYPPEKPGLGIDLPAEVIRKHLPGLV